MVILVLFINSSIAPGIAVLAYSTNPLQDGIVATLGWDPHGGLARGMALLAALPLLSGMLASLYAASRHLYSLSRGGYLPEFLSLTWRKNGAPVVATVVVVLMSGILSALAQYVKVSPTVLVSRNANVRGMQRF